MSLQQTLLKARQCVQAGQYDAGIKHYRGLLRLMPNHPQINSELGVLLLQRSSPELAIPHLSKTVSALPKEIEPWVCLLVAHQRCGDLIRARQVLVQMHEQGFDSARLAVFEQELNEPTPEAVQALVQLIESGNRISAEIAARMMLADYPTSATAKGYLTQVLQMEVANEQ